VKVSYPEKTGISSDIHLPIFSWDFTPEQITLLWFISIADRSELLRSVPCGD